MLRSVQFNDQFGSSTVKVHYKFANDALFVNFHRIFAEKQIPELTLMGRHFPAKPPGILQLAVIFWYGHFYPLRPRFARPPLPKGEASGAPNALHRKVYRSAPLKSAEQTDTTYSTVNSVHSILLYSITSIDFFMPSFS